MSNIIITAVRGHTKAVRTGVQYNKLGYRQVVITSFRHEFISAKIINTFKETVILHSATCSYKDNLCL